MSWREKTAACVLAAALALTASGALAAEGRTEIYVNGKRAAFTDRAFEEAGRLLVPVRAFGERLGAEVLWDAASETVTLLRAPYEARMTVGSTGAVRGGQPVELDAPPQLVGGSVYIPLRFAADCLGAKVDYDPAADCAFVDFEAKRGNTNGNIINGGYAAEDEEYIYFSSPVQNFTWKIDKRTQECTPLIRCCASELNTVDGWVYAWLWDRGAMGAKELGFFRFRPDGSELTKVTDLKLRNISIVNNKIFAIHSGHGVCSMNLDGSGYYLISEYGFTNLNATDNWLVLNDNLVERMDPDTGAFVPISQDTSFIGKTVIQGEYIYYLDFSGKMGLYRCKMDGSENERIIDADISLFNMNGDYIFFSKPWQDDGLYRATLDGQEIVQLSQNTINTISVIGDEIFADVFTYDTHESKVMRIKSNGSDALFNELDKGIL